MFGAWRPDEIRAGAALALAIFAAVQGAPRALPGDLPTCPRPVSVRDTESGHSAAVRCAAPGEPEGEALRGPARLLFGLGIDPNRADAATLDALPGVGPARAAAIVAGRAAGPYRSASDLLEVPGIGPATLEGVRGWLVFPEARRAPARAGSLPRIPREPSP